MWAQRGWRTDLVIYFDIRHKNGARNPCKQVKQQGRDNTVRRGKKNAKQTLTNHERKQLTETGKRQNKQRSGRHMHSVCQQSNNSTGKQENPRKHGQYSTYIQCRKNVCTILKIKTSNTKAEKTTEKTNRVAPN